MLIRFPVRSAQDIGEAIWKGLDERLKTVSDGEAEVMKVADLAAKQGLIPFIHFCTYKNLIFGQTRMRG